MSRNDEYIVINLDDALSTIKACLVAAGGSKDDAVLYEQCKSAGPKPSDFIRRQFSDMQRLRNALGDIVSIVHRECPSLEVEHELGPLPWPLCRSCHEALNQQGETHDR